MSQTAKKGTVQDDTGRDQLPFSGHHTKTNPTAANSSSQDAEKS